MADSEKIGRPWADDELDAIVAAYFEMLGRELAGQAYVKAHYTSELMARLGRTHRSVEFKQQNISAVLDELGLPWIRGYKPKRNYQGSIFDAIDRRLAAGSAAKFATPPVTLPEAAGAVFVDAPPLQPAKPRPAGIERLVRKYDPVDRESRNRALGKYGEEFVIGVERKSLVESDRKDLAAKVRWVSVEDGDGAGYDVLSFDSGGSERLIEVKTTNGSVRTPFFLTRRESEAAVQYQDRWTIYRVHLFAQSPQIFRIAPPLDKALHLRAETWRASFV